MRSFSAMRLRVSLAAEPTESGDTVVTLARRSIISAFGLPEGAGLPKSSERLVPWASGGGRVVAGGGGRPGRVPDRVVALALGGGIEGGPTCGWGGGGALEVGDVRGGEVGLPTRRPSSRQSQATSA